MVLCCSGSMKMSSKKENKQESEVRESKASYHFGVQSLVNWIKSLTTLREILSMQLHLGNNSGFDILPHYA